MDQDVYMGLAFEAKDDTSSEEIDFPKSKNNVNQNGQIPPLKNTVSESVAMDLEDYDILDEEEYFNVEKGIEKLKNRKPEENNSEQEQPVLQKRKRSTVSNAENKSKEDEEENSDVDEPVLQKRKRSSASSSKRKTRKCPNSAIFMDMKHQQNAKTSKVAKSPLYNAIKKCVEEECNKRNLKGLRIEDKAKEALFESALQHLEDFGSWAQQSADYNKRKQPNFADVSMAKEMIKVNNVAPCRRTAYFRYRDMDENCLMNIAQQSPARARMLNKCSLITEKQVHTAALRERRERQNHRSRMRAKSIMEKRLEVMRAEKEKSK